MDQPAALWCAVALLLATSIIICSSQAANAKPLVNQVANLSSSWINTPSEIIQWPQDGTGFALTPILLTGNDIGTQFMCGFYCPQNQTCYFGILIFQGKDYYLRNGYWESNEVRLVWSANGDHPVKVNATLQLTQSGDLILADADGTLVWSANTGGKSVSGLNLTETGNLVLFNTSKGVVWQSFDHPTDCLLPGQTLFTGMQLTSSMSISNLSRGLYSLHVQSDRLYAYIKPSPSSPNQLYYADNLVENRRVQFMNGSMSFVPAAAARFMKLEPDGHLRVYEWEASAAAS